MLLIRVPVMPAGVVPSVTIARSHSIELSAGTPLVPMMMSVILYRRLPAQPLVADVAVLLPMTMSVLYVVVRFCCTLPAPIAVELVIEKLAILALHDLLRDALAPPARRRRGLR